MMGAAVLLISTAVTLLVIGLASGSHPPLVSSIGASLLAAVTLVARAFRTAPTPAGARPGGGSRRVPPAGNRRRPATPRNMRRAQSATVGPASRVERQRSGAPAADVEIDLELDDPSDAPTQEISPDERVKLRRLSAEVLVVDGHPRYHVPGCQRLSGQDAEPLPVREAIEFGFTACGACRPDTVLIRAGDHR